MIRRAFSLGARSRRPRAYTLIELPFDKLRTARLLAVRRRGPAGYTLIELLTVIAVIMVLLTLLVPSLRMARELARQAAALGRATPTGQYPLPRRSQHPAGAVVMIC